VTIWGRLRHNSTGCSVAPVTAGPRTPNHLAEADRVQAKIILESQARCAAQPAQPWRCNRHTVATAAVPGTLETEEGHDQVLISLDPEFTPAAPVGHDLGSAFGNLNRAGILCLNFPPGHPAIRAPRTGKCGRTRSLRCSLAVQTANREKGRPGFSSTPASATAVRRVANPLSVGYIGRDSLPCSGPDRFPLGHGVSNVGWGETGTRNHRSRPGESPLRGLADHPRPLSRLRGLAAGARRPDHLWPGPSSRNRALVPPTVAPLGPCPRPPVRLTPDAETAPPKSWPSAGDWEAAVHRAGVNLLWRWAIRSSPASSVNETSPQDRPSTMWGRCSGNAERPCKARRRRPYRRTRRQAGPDNRAAWPPQNAARDLVTALKGGATRPRLP